MIDISKSYDLLLEKLTVWYEDLIKLLPNMVLAALVLVLGLFIAGLIKKLASRLISRTTKHQALSNLFTSFIYFIVVGIVLFSVLSILKLDKAVTSILAGAGIVGLALAFAFQDIAANFISGIFISFRRPMRIGDIVKVQDYMGTVEDINLRDTTVLTFQGQRVIIPNKEIFQNPIVNFSLLGKRRMDLVVGVSYGEDLQKVKDIVLEAVKKVTVRTEDEITLFYEEFDDSSINFQLRIWIRNADQPTWLQGRSEAIMYIKKAFDENDITIPFPIRTLDFGIKGGEKLSEVPYFKNREN